MNPIYFLLFFLSKEVLTQLPCLSSLGDPLKCLACSSSYYQLDSKAIMFPESDCLSKGTDTFVSRVLVLAPFSECNNDCQSNFLYVYTSLDAGLEEQSFLASKQKSAEIELFFSAGEHSVLKLDSDVNARKYFRQVNVTIKMGPLTCDYLNQAGLCIPKGQKVFIKLKTNNILLFVSKKLEINNIKFTALDQHYQNLSSPCLDSVSQNCCSSENTVYNNQDSMCSLALIKIDYEIRMQRFWGFFNFETLLSDQPPSPVQITIENSDFQYFFLVNQKKGFITPFTVFWNTRVQIAIKNCSFSDSFYLKGIIYFEKSVDELMVEQWLANLGVEKISNLFSSSVLRSQVNIQNSSCLNYNMPQITDNRKLEEKSLLMMDASTTDALFSDIIFDNLKAQSNDQALIKLVSSANSASTLVCGLIQNVSLRNASNFIMIMVSSLKCINIMNLLVQKSTFEASNALILKSSNSTIKNASFTDLLFSVKQYLITSEVSILLLQDLLISRGKNSKILLDSSLCKMTNVSLSQIVFSYFMLQIKKTDFTMESSSWSDISVPEDLQDIVIYQQENNSYFKDVRFERISALTLKFLDKSNITNFQNCLFTGIYNLTNFLAAESIYLTYYLKNSTIISCAFLNFYFSLNGGRFTVQPKMFLHGLKWINFTVRVGYFSAFSNVLLELKDSEIRDMVGVKKDNFVRFFYIGRSSSFWMENSKVIDCGYNFEPVFKEYAYNYQFLLGQFITSFFKVINSEFISNKPLSLKTGYVASNRNTGKVTIINCTFIVASNDSLSHNGVTFTTTNEIEFINNTLINIRCPSERISVVHEWGAVFMYGEETGKFFKNTKKANVTGNYFQNCTCRGGGGLTVVNYHILNIEDNMFKNNSAWFQIGSLGIWSSSNVLLRNNTIKTSYSPSYGAIRISAVRNITIDKLYLENARSETTSVMFISDVQSVRISNFRTDNIESFSNGGLMYIGNTNMTIYDSNISNIRTNISGGVFFVDIYSNLSVRNCEIRNVEAYSGGVLAVFIGNNILITNITVSNASSKSNGAAFLFEQFYLAKIADVVFVNATAVENGVITIESNDESFGLSLQNIICSNNSAKAGSCIYINSITNISMTNIVAKDCKGVVIRILSDTKIWAFIKDFLGTNNSGDEILNFNSIILVIENLILENNYPNKALINIDQITTGSIKAVSFIGKSPFKFDTVVLAMKITQSLIVLEDMSFDFLKTETQSTVMFSLESKVIIISASIYGSSSFENIGAFLFFNSVVQAIDLKIVYNYGVCFKGIGLGGSFKRIVMMNNTAIDLTQASHFEYSTATNSSITLSLESVNSSISNNGVIMKLKDFSTVVLVKCSFTSNYLQSKNQNSLQQELRGIDAQNVLSIQVMNCLFDSLTTIGRGPALYVTDTLAAVGFNTSSLLILNSTFKFCSSYKGAGAIFISNKKTVLIENNTFLKNAAKTEENLDLSEFEGVGAVGIILCYPSDSSSSMCRTSLIDNIFEDNYAFYHSPLLYVNSTTNIDRSIYMNNSDQINFTKTVTSYPPDIKILFPEKELGQTYFHLSAGANLSTVSFLNSEFNAGHNVLDLRAGSPFNITFYITDSQDNILVFDDFSYGSLEVVGAFKYQIKIENGVAKAHKGWFNFSNVRIFGWPDSTVGFQFLFKIPKYTILNPDPIILKQNMLVHFFSCVKGEIILNDMQCYECPYNSFSTVDPMVQIKEVEKESKLFIPAMKCSPCLSRAYCPGGWAVFPVSGNWRLSNATEKIIECLIPQACVGYEAKSPLSVNLKGTCKEGHYGNLCHDCLMEYGKLNSNFPCGKCDEVLKGALARLILAVVMIISYAIFGSYLYSRQREKKEGYLFVYLRIGISFSQITSLLTYIKIEWPMVGLNQFQSMSSNSLSLTSEDVLLNDCLIQQANLEARQVYAFKMIISIFLPLILFALSSLVWIFFILIIQKHKLDKQTLKDFYIKIFASLIISVFLFHPLIIKTSFNMLNCFVIDPSISSDEFLFVYPNFKCWDSFHVKVILFAVLPGIFIWGLGFPIGLLFLLITQSKFKEKMKSRKIKEEDESPSNAGKSRSEMIPLENMWAVRVESVKESKCVKSLTENESSDLNRSMTPVKSGKSGRFEKLKKLVLKSNLFQFLHHGYKEQYSYWECLIFIKKFFLSMLINFNQMFGFEMVNLLILLVLSLHLYLHITKKPYLVKSLNQLEFLCLIGSITIFLSVIILQANLNLPSQYFFASVIFAGYLVCLGLTTFHVVMSLRRMELMKKITKLRASMKTLNTRQLKLR